MKSNKGFTLVELLVVLIIVAILAAVAAPLYLGNVQRSRMSEAVAVMSAIRQAQREFRVSTGAYRSQARVASPNATNSIINRPLTGTAPLGLNVPVGVTKYFSAHTYSVVLGEADFNEPTGYPAAIFNAALAAAAGNPTAPTDFLIVMESANNFACTAAATECATSSADVANYAAVMDNSGRILVTYNGGTNWEVYQ